MMIFVPSGQILDRFDDPFAALRGDGFAADRAMGDADAGIEDSQIVVNFGHRPDSGAGIASGGFLFDGDGGGDAGGMFEVRFGHFPSCRLAKVESDST